MIPQKIHHIWLQGGIPDKYLDNWIKWDEALPHWVHKVWDGPALLNLCTDEQKDKYMKLETLINRVNYLKYILMYHEGGIYADLDSYPIQDLNKFFKERIIKDIDLESKLSIRYPFNSELPDKPFEKYDIILVGRKTMFFYPNGDKPILLDNPILMGSEKNLFWLKLLDWCEKRTNLKSGAMAEMEFLPHEPYGPYGMTDFLFTNYKEPYLQGILVLPPTYLMADRNNLNNNMYVVHAADQGW